MFTTDRLRLRGYEESDLDLLRKLWNTEAVQRTISIDYLRPRSLNFKEFIEKKADAPGLFVIIETNKPGTFPQFVGFANLDLQHQKHRDANYSIALMPEFWGKGYATEVTKFAVDHGFHHFGLHRISLGVLGGNETARNVYKKM
ncbi:hypothetical protein PQX77_010434 [Marasmius sp. AFHP31]|nr:hypothetical protein PQX77_010434 [Marasmius sp. AFHP31]